MISTLRAHLLDSVRLRLKADVPVGIYLSGGIDSSALAGIANHLVRKEGVRMGSMEPEHAICCFSIGFDTESGFDESGESLECIMRAAGNTILGATKPRLQRAAEWETSVCWLECDLKAGMGWG
jgi:asparagine synthetase B (glutamine-hydrolysing)